MYMSVLYRLLLVDVRVFQDITCIWRLRDSFPSRTRHALCLRWRISHSHIVYASTTTCMVQVWACWRWVRGSIDWFIQSVLHSSIHSFINLFFHSFINSFVRSFIHLFIHSFQRSIDPLVDWFIDWFGIDGICDWLICDWLICWFHCCVFCCAVIYTWSLYLL
jgi:hypothetical protein